ncbi:MAG: hypothetical protein ACI9SC_001863 [Gammaproteobacteria bacterium]|jgi:hypothetical protein
MSSCNKSPGQAMVEFLIVLPILLTLLLGTLQFALIYQTKITLNYAAFEAARAGSLKNAQMVAMQNGFASAMAAQYTHEANSDAYIDGRKVVRQQIIDGYVNIKLINPSPLSFTNHGYNSDVDLDGDDVADGVRTIIPNDNLMYRDSQLLGDQSLQDANLLKVHIGYCYELIVPFVNRIIWAMQRYGPGAAPAADANFGRWWTDDSAPPGFFGPPTFGTFAYSCIRNPTHSGRLSIVLYSQGIIRMQTFAVLESP